MGKPDVVLNVYMNRPDRIRSVLEYYLGEKLPEDWEWTEIKGLYPTKNHEGKLASRQRDLVGKVCAWGTHFWLGVENQNKINLIFPWRLMKMDCLTYEKEIEEIREKNQSVDRHYGKEDDFLYCYGKEDRVRPILNLTLYWGREEWKHPLSLREMMGGISALPAKLQQLTGDYTVNIIQRRRISEEALQKMDSDLKYVLGIMKRTGSPQKYRTYIRENKEFFSRIPRSALDVIDICTNIKDISRHLKFVMNQESKEEEADMCRALDEIQKSAENKGLQRGIRQGREEGINQGRKEGINQGMQLIQRLLADGRQEDVARVAKDVPYRQKLFAEYRI